MRARFGPRRPRVGPRRPKRSELAGWGCSPDEHATAVCVFQRSETGAFERPYEQPHAMPGAIFRRACHARGDLAGRQYYRNRVNDCVQARSLFCNRAVTRPCSVAVCCGGRRAGGRRSGGPRSRSEPSPAKTDSLYHAGMAVLCRCRTIAGGWCMACNSARAVPGWRAAPLVLAFGVAVRCAGRPAGRSGRDEEHVEKISCRSVMVPLYQGA